MTSPFFDDATPIEAVIARERALNTEYGPISPSCWFMYDNHTFAKLTGTPEQMGQQALRHMQDDRYCGSVFVRASPDGQEISGLCFHGDYRKPENTIRRVAQWIEDMRLLTEHLPMPG